MHCGNLLLLIVAERPITFIIANFNPIWNSFIGTPPFPTYASGHASFSGGIAKILSKGLKGSVAFTDSTKIPLGFAPRSFDNYEKAAKEAAVSRLYGGIHYTFDNDNGFNCSQIVAQNVLKDIHWK